MKRVDLSTQRFGRLVVIELAGSRRGSSLWKCLCDCGQIKFAINGALRSGSVRSCGCLRDEILRRPKKHGLSYTPEYGVWSGMVTRCYNKRDHSYPNYGGRGILMCSAVKDSVSAIIAVIGRRPKGFTIDRIDNSQGYNCGKCTECTAHGWALNMRWATLIEQGENQRSNRVIEINGVRKTESAWARYAGIKQVTMAARLIRGWTGEKLLAPVATK